MFAGFFALPPPELVLTGTNFSGSDGAAAATGNVVSTVGGVSVQGGTGGYTYSWALISNTQGPTQSVLSGGTTANPVLRALSVNDGLPSICTWRVTVTDSGGRTKTKDLTSTLTWTNNS